jgi:uncharacterized membrane protein
MLPSLLRLVSENVMDEPPASLPVPTPGATGAPSGAPHPELRPRAVGAGRGAHWWTEGWRIFAAAPAIWLVIAVIYIALMLGLALIPVIGPIASTLLTPILAGGTLLGARAVDRGEPLTVGHLFACFQQRTAPLVILALLTFAGWLVIWSITLAALIAVAGLGVLSALVSGDPLQIGTVALTTIGTAALVVLLLMALLAVPLMMALWFAPALILFADAEPWAAMKTSFAGCLENVAPSFVYGLIGILLALLATLPFGLGWLVLGPMVAASAYASYGDVFGRPN